MGAEITIMPKIPAIFTLLILLVSCRPGRQVTGSPAADSVKITREKPLVNPDIPVSKARTDAFLEDLLARNPGYFADILAKRQDLKVQVIYTQINRKGDNSAVFSPYYFNVDAQSYYYPASTVKMPIALLALEKLRSLGIPALNPTTAMITGASHSGQTEVLNDPTTADGVPGLGQYIKKIFLVSDNDAFNRLYEFLGQDYINQKLKEKGYTSAGIYHRLALPLSQEENRHTNLVKFMDSSGNLLFTQPPLIAKAPYPGRNDHAGIGYLKGGKLVKEPMDFSTKNRFGLEDLTRVLQSILFPESVPASQQFRIREEDRRMVMQYMSQYPGESDFPQYPAPEYWDTYCKFLYYGSDSVANTKSSSFRIFNKVGDAYGFLTDIAYFADFEKGIEFMLSATIYCNSDGILNDDKYDYDSVGYPFMKNLGQVIYDYELKRVREVKPNLGEFKMDYDKR